MGAPRDWQKPTSEYAKDWRTQKPARTTPSTRRPRATIAYTVMGGALVIMTLLAAYVWLR
ncbi:hypothetical protein [Flavimobilis marinus]|nr:hypothetical protein [Flavimobilis marinus]